MGETTSIQKNIVHEFYMQSQDHPQLWLLISQLLIDIYDCHLITCSSCGAIHNTTDQDYVVEDTLDPLYPQWDSVFKCSCWEYINPNDCPDLFY